ncbi:MAG: hypothetical protein LKJ05_02850 [Bifidobacteriaceae bacterium]|jgi:hypothetical protein|nr:hypothetical protein [Bifidobacteriaceae bacterium]
MQHILSEIISGMGGGGVLIAAIGLVLKLAPGLWQRAADSLLNTVDFSKLDADSQARKLYETVSQEEDYHTKFDHRLDEVQKDQIKPVIMQLISLPGDHSHEVAYEMDKLEDLGADCWIMPVARDYIADHSHKPTTEEK